MAYTLRIICTLLLMLQATLWSLAGTFYIKGHLLPGKDDTAWRHTVYLSRMASINDFMSSSPGFFVDSAAVSKDGKFLFKNAKVITANTFYRLEVVTKDRAGTTYVSTGGTSENYAFLLLQPNSQISFSTELGRFNYALKPVRMDAANLAIRRVYDMGRSTMEAMEPIRSRILRIQDNPATSPDTLKKLRGEIATLRQDLACKMKPVIDTVKDPYVSLLTLINNFYPDSAFCVKMNGRYQREIPRSKYAGQFFDAVYDIYYTLPIGSRAPEIESADTSGAKVRLSSFRGKYVLIDFWASWCHPCRMENQEIVKPLYNQYAQGNFAVISISMDTDPALWKGAIKTDHLNWTELCDLQGVQSTVARQYKVTDVPVTYIIDPAGNIIAKNLHGVQLQDFITGKLAGK